MFQEKKVSEPLTAPLPSLETYMAGPRGPRLLKQPCPKPCPQLFAHTSDEEDNVVGGHKLKSTAAVSAVGRPALWAITLLLPLQGTGSAHGPAATEGILSVGTPGDTGGEALRSLSRKPAITFQMLHVISFIKYYRILNLT